MNDLAMIRAAALRDTGKQSARDVRQRKRLSREPHGHVDTYTAKTGGSVLVTRTRVFYSAPCADCPGRAWSVRDRGSGGAWPKRCPDCRRWADWRHDYGDRSARARRTRERQRPQLEANRRHLEALWGRPVRLKDMQAPKEVRCSGDWSCVCDDCTWDDFED